MLINCPKCGFSQPKDQYCASCGVDMLSYIPAAPPLWKQVLVNPVFLIAITMSVVAGSVVYIRQGQRDELASRARLLRSGPMMVDQSDNLASAGPAAVPAQTAQPIVQETAQASAQTPTPSESPAEVAAVASAPVKMLASTALTPSAAATATPAPSASPDASPGGAAARRDRVVNAVIYYTEVNRQTLDQMEEESQGSGQFTDFGEFKAGPVADITKRLSRQNGVVVLQKVSRAFDARNSQQQWFVGNKTADNQDVGITTLIVLDTSVPGRLRGEIELLKSFPEQNQGEVTLRKSSSPAMNFDIPNKYGMMVHMALPRQIAKDNEDILGPEGIMRIFDSTAFKNQSSEFTLFIDFDTSAP